MPLKWKLRIVIDCVKKKPALPDVDWSRDTPVFHKVIGDLQSIKTAWRNPGMHIEATYTNDEASQAYNVVRLFMEHLAVELPGPAVFA